MTEEEFLNEQVSCTQRDYYNFVEIFENADKSSQSSLSI